MTPGHLAQIEEEAQNAPRRVSKPPQDGLRDNGATVTVTVQGKSFELTDDQLEEAANRVALENSLKKKPRTGGIAAEQLRSIVQRLERLHEEKDGIAGDIKDLFAEAKSNGYDVPTLKKILKLRAMDASERAEADHLLNTYCVALGMRQPDLFDGEE